MKNALLESRARFRTPDDLLGRLRCLLTLHRCYVVDCAGDQFPGTMVGPYRTLLKHGRIVWGCFAQANNELYRTGSEDLPACSVYSTDPYFEDQVKELSAIAHAVYALKHKHPEDRELARVADSITNEYSQTLHEPLPRQMTGGRAVYLSTMIVHRRQLPSGAITGTWFPLLICPQKTPMNLMLPLRYWSPDLVRLWQERKPSDSRKASRLPAIPSGKYGPAAVVEPESLASIRARYQAKPLQLTGGAATAAHRLLRERGGGPDQYMHVYTEPGLGGVKYGIALDVKPPKPGDFETESWGVRIVAEGRSLQHLVGRVIDYMEGPMSNGFTVTHPDT